MGGSYKLCIECGKRALSIATRCPGCGREFQTLILPEGGPALELSRFLSPGVVAVVLAAAAVLTTARLGRSSPPLEHESSFVAADSIAASSDVAYAMAATARLDTAGAAALPAESAGELRVARTWTRVRKSRSKSANLEAVLTPGDTVLADSLERGWYRVALEGEVLGYVHRSTLTAGAATEQPEVREGRPARTGR
jgi:uncharacterized protein YgiM (DUF1202 family)